MKCWWFEFQTSWENLFVFWVYRVTGFLLAFGTLYPQLPPHSYLRWVRALATSLQCKHKSLNCKSARAVRSHHHLIICPQCLTLKGPKAAGQKHLRIWPRSTSPTAPKTIWNHRAWWFVEVSLSIKWDIGAVKLTELEKINGFARK